MMKFVFRVLTSSRFVSGPSKRGFRTTYILKNDRRDTEEAMCKNEPQKPPFSLEPHNDGNAQVFKLLSLMFVLPAILAGSIAILIFKQDEEPPPYIEYEYLHRLTKAWPWKDGKRSLFHNPRKNPIPGEGYEALDENDE